MKFYSETLQSSFDEAKPILEQLGSIEEAVVKDINELEVFLKKIALNESFLFHLKSPNIPLHHEELLIWDHKKKHIIYVENRFSITCHSGEKGYYPRINYKDKETLVEMPLLDVNIEIQKRIWDSNKLALFLSFITKQVNAGVLEPSE